MSLKKEPEYKLILSSYERRQLSYALTEARNARVRERKPTEPLDELLIKVQDAPLNRGLGYAR